MCLVVYLPKGVALRADSESEVDMMENSTLGWWRACNLLLPVTHADQLACDKCLNPLMQLRRRRSLIAYGLLRLRMLISLTSHAESLISKSSTRGPAYLYNGACKWLMYGGDIISL